MNNEAVQELKELLCGLGLLPNKWIYVFSINILIVRKLISDFSIIYNPSSDKGGWFVPGTAIKNTFFHRN